jgi:hypothetical protein
MSRGSQGISVGFPVSSGAREPAPATSQDRDRRDGRLEVREDDQPPRFQLTYRVESAFAQNSRSCVSDLNLGIFFMASRTPSALGLPEGVESGFLGRVALIGCCRERPVEEYLLTFGAGHPVASPVYTTPTKLPYP